MRHLAPLALAAAACGSEAPVPGPELACGSVAVELFAIYKRGCSADEWYTQEDVRTAALATPFENSVDSFGNRATLRASCTPSTRTLTFAGRAERTCGVHCAGGGAHAELRWEGALRLPASAPGWRVRVAVEAVYTAPDRVVTPAGRCVIETPWRSPIVVDAPRLEREVDVPPGTAAVRVVCVQPPATGGFVSTACIGAPAEPRPLEVAPAWIEATLTVRVDASPR